MRLTARTIGEWYLAVNRNMSFLHQWLSVEGHVEGMRLFGFKTKFTTFSITKGFQSFVYYFTSASESLVAELRRLVQSPRQVKLLDANYHRYGERLLQATARLNTVTLSNSGKTVTALRSYFKAYGHYTSALNITALGGGRLTGDLYESIQQDLHCSRQRTGRLISKLTFPNQPTPTQTEEQELLQLATRTKTITEIHLRRALWRHYQRYRAIPANFVGEPWGWLC